MPDTIKIKYAAPLRPQRQKAHQGKVVQTAPPVYRSAAFRGEVKLGDVFEVPTWLGAKLLADFPERMVKSGAKPTVSVLVTADEPVSA